MKFQEGKFQNTLKALKSYYHSNYDPGTVCFGKFDPYHPYRLEENRVIYHLQKGEGDELKLIETDADKPRAIEKPKIIKRDVLHVENSIYLQFELCEFLPEDIDIVLNEHYLCIYACFKNRPIVSELYNKIACSGPQETFNSSREVLWMGKFNNKLLNNKSYSEMKRSIEKADFLLKNGTLQITLPKNCS